MKNIFFYRGLGLWDGPLFVKTNSTHMTIENSLNTPIDACWILVRRGDRGFIRRIPVIAQKDNVVTSLLGISDFTGFHTMEHMSVDNYISAASVNLEIELSKSGLFDLESRAMVNTWEKSYFHSTGVRVLYVAPKQYPDDLLPWSIKPIPNKVERVLVGRVEVLLMSEEETLRPIVLRVLSHFNTRPTSTRGIEVSTKKINNYPTQIQDDYKEISFFG